MKVINFPKEEQKRGITDANDIFWNLIDEFS